VRRCGARGLAGVQEDDRTALFRFQKFLDFIPRERPLRCDERDPPRPRDRRRVLILDVGDPKPGSEQVRVKRADGIHPRLVVTAGRQVRPVDEHRVAGDLNAGVHIR
jgi:hypothetical protein